MKSPHRDTDMAFLLYIKKSLNVKHPGQSMVSILSPAALDSKVIHMDQAFPQTKTNLGEKHWLLFSDISILNSYQRCNKKLI